MLPSAEQKRPFLANGAMYQKPVKYIALFLCANEFEARLTAGVASAAFFFSQQDESI
jgi:hypothetical protein